MGENTKARDQHAAVGALREQIRHTESHITETVQNLEHRLSPRTLRRRGVRNAKRVAWQATAKVLGFAQRTSVQAALVGGGTLWMVVRSLKGRREPETERAAKAKAAPERREPGARATAAGATGLWMLSRAGKAREAKAERAGGKPSVSGLLLAATAAKAFLGGARASAKKGTTKPGRKTAWRGLATALGAALGTYWYSHRGHGA